MRFFTFILISIFAFYALYADEAEVQPPPPAETADKPTPAALAFSELVCISFQLLDDNAPFIGVRDGLPYLRTRLGPDDAFTLALRLDFAWLKPLWIVDRIKSSVMLNVFTWRLDTLDSGYRLDFLSGLCWLEHDFGGLCLGAALGFLGRGNFGGWGIQNLFHYIGAFDQYTTPYLDATADKAGPLFGAKARFDLELFQALGFTVSGALYLRGVWDILAVGRSSLWMGSELQAVAGVFRFLVSGGYRLSTTSGDSVLEQMFGSGLFLFSKLCIRLGDFTIGIGLAIDPYGNAPVYNTYFDISNNRQFFWSVSYGDASRLDPLDSFLP